MMQTVVEFLSVLGSVIGRFGWRLYADCRMDNHYHLLLETPKSPTCPRACAG